MAGRVARRFGSKQALIAGTAITAVSFAWLAVAHSHPYDMLITSSLLGIGIGLAFAALGNLIVQAVPPTQTGVASRHEHGDADLGGALGGQLSATFIVDNTAHGLPTVTGFDDTFVMATAFLVVCVLAGLLIPGGRAPRPRACSRRAARGARRAARGHRLGRERTSREDSHGKVQADQACVGVHQRRRRRAAAREAEPRPVRQGAPEAPARAGDHAGVRPGQGTEDRW